VGGHPSGALPPLFWQQRHLRRAQAHTRRSRVGAGPPPPTIVGRGPSPLPTTAWPCAPTRHPVGPYTPPCPLFLSIVPSSCHKKASAVVPFPFSPRSFSPALKHVAASLSFLELAHRPRTAGSSLPSPISAETRPSSARSVSR
jgi:hypothetical protein